MVITREGSNPYKFIYESDTLSRLQVSLLFLYYLMYFFLCSIVAFCYSFAYLNYIFILVKRCVCCITELLLFMYSINIFLSELKWCFCIATLASLIHELEQHTVFTYKIPSCALAVHFMYQHWFIYFQHTNMLLYVDSETFTS